MPKDQTSDFELKYLLLSTSGGLQRIGKASLSVTSSFPLERPKSATLATPFLSRRTFLAAKSRWTRSSFSRYRIPAAISLHHCSSWMKVGTVLFPLISSPVPCLKLSRCFFRSPFEQFSCERNDSSKNPVTLKFIIVKFKNKKCLDTTA